MTDETRQQPNTPTPATTALLRRLAARTAELDACQRALTRVQADAARYRAIRTVVSPATWARLRVAVAGALEAGRFARWRMTPKRLPRWQR